MSFVGSDIKLRVSGRTADAYLAQPENGGPGVLVLHAWWGLNMFFRQVCDRLARHGFTALAPDLYKGRVAITIDDAKALMEKRDFEFMRDAVKAAGDHLASLTGGRLGVVGFSMGASWALLAAAKEQNIAAAVLFYGVNDVDFRQVRAKVLGHYAEVDDWEPLEGVHKMEADMRAAGLDVTIHVYPEVHHWFMEADRLEYAPYAAQLAWERTFEFLDKSLA